VELGPAAAAALDMAVSAFTLKPLSQSSNLIGRGPLSILDPFHPSRQNDGALHRDGMLSANTCVASITVRKALISAAQSILLL
jgi:hypothetical protein